MYRKLDKVLLSRKRTARLGFTLTEVVVAAALLIIAIVPILKGLTTVHLNSSIIEHKSYSLAFAQMKLDEIKGRSIYHFTNDGAAFSANNAVLSGSYLCNVTDNLGDPLKEITVSVGFDEDGDSSLSSDEVDVSLVTYLARRS